MDNQYRKGGLLAMLDIAIKGFYTINEDGSVNKHNDQKIDT